MFVNPEIVRDLLYTTHTITHMISISFLSCFAVEDCGSGVTSVIRFALREFTSHETSSNTHEISCPRIDQIQPAHL